MPSQARKVRKAPQLLTINGSSHPSQSQKNVHSMTPSSSVRARITDVRFVVCESQTAAEAKTLEDAFQFCRSRNLTEAKLVQGRELESFTQESDGPARVIYIVHPFSGPAFCLLKDRNSRIYGPGCIVTCVRKNQPIPTYNGYPIASMAMMNVEVCCSNMEGPPRDALYEKVGSMGGRITKGLSTTATHLVTPQVGSPKYYAAAKAGKKIVLPSWVDEIFKAASTGEDFSRDEQLVERHKVPVFRGCSISISQIPSMEIRKAFQDRIRSHGGDYQKDMCKEKTTHLVCDEPSGHKFVAAKKWNIPVVTTNWITDCINRGYNIQVDQYLLLEVRPITPEHVKQGPNGMRATSTPNKGAKRLDHTLDISAIQRGPIVEAADPNRQDGPGLPNHQEEPVVWVPNHGKIAEKQKQQHMLSTKVHQDPPSKSETETVTINGENAGFGRVVIAPSAVPSVLNGSAKLPVVEAENVPVDSVAPKNFDVMEAIKDEIATGVGSSASASPNSESVRDKNLLAPSLAERILAGMLAQNTAAVSPASDEPSPLSSNQQQMLDVLKLERRIKPAATRIRKNTRNSPIQQRALLCWSQAPRNPFKENGQGGEGLQPADGDVDEEGEESPPIDVAPQPLKNLPAVPTSLTTGKLKQQQKESIVKDHVAGPSAAITVSVQGAKNGKSKDSLSGAEKPNSKRNVELVELSDDEPKLTADTTEATSQKLVKKIEEPKRAYIFMVSGVTIESEKKRLFSCIRQLGATYADSVQYTPEASHLIVKFPVRNEKYLACCAAGKWVLHAKYLEDSVTAGHFLPEIMYEWGNYEHAATLMSAMSECDTKLAKSVHRWRQKVQTSGKLAFEGWKVVLAADPARSEGYIRLLEAGGAKVLTAKCPFLPHKDEATHLLHELTKVAVSPTDLAAFVAAGVVCQKADYLSHFLTDESCSAPTPSQPAQPSHSRRPAKKSRR